MIRAALTGSIGMGKSTTARLFAERGAAVWDADAAVHRLYAAGGAAVAPVSRLAPDAAVDGAIDRARLREAVLADPTLLSRVEAAVHPLVSADRAAFLERAEAEGRRVAVCDIPLLFETDAAGGFDAVIVATAPPEVQRDRVLARPGMTPDAFAAILSRQTPDAEKRMQADFLVETSRGLEPARERVDAIMQILETPQ